MSDGVHEKIVALLGDHPEWIDALLQQAGHGSLPPGLCRIVPPQALVEPVDLRPDLLLADGERGPWVAVEVLFAKDAEKERRWPLLVMRLLTTRGRMGDVLVLTNNADVMEWARNLEPAVGPLGMRLEFRPVVVHLRAEQVEALLDPAPPDPSFFAGPLPPQTRRS